MAEEDVNPKQLSEVEILNPESRMFKSWGSVEVRDRENDLLPMREFRKIMPVIMKRGGILMDRHSNRQVGKILNFEFMQKETPEGLKDGVMITGEIFNDYEHDDMVWQGIKDGVYKGLSFGGRNKIKDVKFDKKGLTNILTKLEGFEFSLVPGMGNQEATMEEINFLAKGKVDKTYEKDGAHVHAEDSLGLHNHPEIENIITAINERLLNLELKEIDASGPIELSKDEDTDDKDNKKVLTEKDLSLSTTNKNDEKYLKVNDLNKTMEPEDLQKQNEMIEKNSNAIEEINKKLDLLVKQKEEDDEDKDKKKEGKEEDEEDKEKKKQDDDDEDKKPKDKKPEEELGKADGAEGEKKVKLPKVGEEDTGGGEQAQGGEGEDVKFVEKSEFDEVQKKLDDLTNKAAQTPRPAQMINKALDGKSPKNQKDIAKMLIARNSR